jgi:hypothetical protein
MKKFVILALAVALIAFFAMPRGASAAMNVFMGDYQVVGVMTDNINDFNDEVSDKEAFVYQRFRLTYAAVSPGVKGIIQIEIGWDEWGKAYTQGFTGGDQGVNMDTRRPNIETRMAFIDFKIPDTPISVQVGKGPCYTKNQHILTAALMAPSIKVKSKVGDSGNFEFFWIKHTEGDIRSDTTHGNADDDADIYHAQFDHKTKNLKLGISQTYYRDRRQVLGLGGSGGAAQEYTQDIHYTSAWAGTKIGPLDFEVHGIYQYGEKEYIGGYSVGDTYDIKAFFIEAMGKMKFDSCSLAVGTMYGSGDGDLNDKDKKTFHSIDADTSYPSAGLMYPGPNIYNWGHGIAGETYHWTGMFQADYYPEGWWFTYARVTVPWEKWQFVGTYWYLLAAKDPSATYRDKDIGHEIDLVAHYKMHKNLTVSFEADYLLAGDFENPSADVSSDDAYKLAWRVLYKF